MKHFYLSCFSVVALMLCGSRLLAQTNTVLGYHALNQGGSGTNYNTVIGYMTAYSLTNGSYNVAIGEYAMIESFSENGSVAIGPGAMTLSNATIGDNVAIGGQALYGGSTGNQGNYNTVVGTNGLHLNTTGSWNTATGDYSMYNNSTGFENVASGDYSLYGNTTGYYNVASGRYSMYGNTSGSYNVASGAEALPNNTTGSENIGIGIYSLTGNTTGTYNIAVGAFAGTNSGSLTNAMALGNSATVSASNSVVVGSSSITSIGGYAGWTNFSDGRYKKNIQQNVPGLAFINKLTPITYNLDIDGIEAKLHANTTPTVDKTTGKEMSASSDPVLKQAMQEKSAITYTGFVAQDVEKAADSVGFTFSGVDKPKDANQSFYGLRYGDFVVPLVKAVQELSAGSDRKDSIINSIQGKLDSMQTQMTELKALIMSKNSSAMTGASLDQNYPNPFNGSTTIGYTLPEGTSSAQMQITDITGKVLALIPLSGTGKNTITTSVSGNAAGTYTYSLIINGKLAGTREMIATR